MEYYFVSLAMKNTRTKEEGKIPVDKPIKTCLFSSDECQSKQQALGMAMNMYAIYMDMGYVIVNWDVSTFNI